MNIQDKSGYLINRAALSVKALLQHRFADNEIDLTPEQWALMGIIWNSSSELTNQKLSENTFREKSTVSRNLKKLEQKGLIQFETNSDDSRQKFIQPTERSLTLKPQVLRQVKYVLKTAEKNIDPADLAVTLKTLRQIDRNLQEEMRDEK